MKISQVSSRTNFTSQNTLVQRNQTIKEPAYKKIFAQKAASYSGLTLGYETALHSKQAYNMALEMLEGAKKVQQDVENSISRGEANLFENFTDGKKSAQFQYDKNSNMMHMKELSPSGALFRHTKFNENGIHEITLFDKNSDTAVSFERNKIAKIEKNKQELSDGSKTADKVIIFKNEKPSKIFFNYSEDEYGAQHADSAYEYDLYRGRWDWGHNYKKEEESLFNDDYTKYDERYGFLTGKGLVAQAKDYNDQIIKKTARQLILFEQGRILARQANCNLDKKDWTNSTIAVV